MFRRRVFTNPPKGPGDYLKRWLKEDPFEHEVNPRLELEYRTPTEFDHQLNPYLDPEHGQLAPPPVNRHQELDPYLYANNGDVVETKKGKPDKGPCWLPTLDKNPANNEDE